ncbi:amidase [Aldersonia sp. NBC_00410]|uniref:amidase n=1 Tax=Aldersonia sp. NBC_00410 TaxID=2975954 RepID=UPI002255A0E6|nr:amidase [Aldersonia sp. NBC_00410]MCX5043674.1 amidase [Aldersonia sp. NBC_00410]
MTTVPDQRPADLADWTATELVAGYRHGDVSPVEATESVLDRIGKGDQVLNAFTLADAEAALPAARESERRWRTGQPASPLDGVPTSIKDLLLTRGWPTQRGSKSVDPNQDWPVDSPAVARLREGGAVLVGKTTTPELGWKGVTDNPLTGITRNPWNPARTSGGSSGGGAAAVAAGMGPLAVGTDGGGSVRIPGSFCGVVGFKATYGTVPIYPPSPFGTLAHVGPMTRTVADTALMLDVVTGPDSRDWSALATPTAPFRFALDTPLTGLRVAFSADLGHVAVDPEVADLVARAVEVLGELGAQIETVDPGFDDPVWAFECLWFAGAAKATEHLTDGQRAELDPELAKACEQGRSYSAQDYLEATARRMNLGVQMGAFHEQYDLLVTPTMPIVAFEAGRDVPEGSSAKWWTGWTPFTYPFNLTQQPAITVPCGFTATGLPVGLQFVGPRHADVRVLNAAKAYEDNTNWWRQRPNL